ncbi:MAG: PstS family phosphate ABC transporter substrate-binding protein [Clostridiales bacterium]|nr:PstS family phosphate ABC transporter substrate-binding protein [Clostridiales bacterium]
MMRLHRTGVIAILVVSLLLMGLLAGCGSSSTPAPTPPAENGEQEEPVEDLSGFFEIKGSDSEVNLVQAMVEAFANVNDVAEFSVTGGGSGTGIAALINKQTDIANSSRPMKDGEIAQARANGVEPVPVVFSMDGLAVIVHEDNPVTELSVEQIGKIFAGEITNWSEVGGENKPISMYGRQSNSGTYVFFMERVVRGDYSQAMQNMNGNSQIVEGVRADTTGIGYVAIGYLQGASGISALSVAETEAGPFVTPLDTAKVKGGEYVLTRPLYQYFNGVPTGALRQFVDFELSAEGQALVEAEGFLPVTSGFMQENNKYIK